MEIKKEDKKENTNRTGGVSKNTLYLIGVVVLVLGLFLAFNVSAALTQGKPQITSTSYSNPAVSGVQSSSSNNVIPSQVGGCN